MKPQNAVARHLRWYWRMEAGNVVFVPAMMIALAHLYGGGIGPASAIAMASMSFLLIVGAVYWRVKLAEIEHGRDPTATLRVLALLDAPSFIVAVIGLGAGLGAVAFASVRVGAADATVAMIAGVLAAAEYVNYYRVQLQHFDQWSDFKRLMRGRGFRKAHLRRDIDRLGAGADKR